MSAIPHFEFSKVGVTEDGKVRIRVENRSQSELLYLTIGVRDPGRMTGGIALPASGIPPGGVRVLEEDLYRGSMDPHRVELFRRPLPDPEDRPYYAEFRDTPFKTSAGS